MALGIWGGVALVGGIIAAILALLYSTVGLTTTLSIAFVVICILMMLIILAQKPKGGGLSGAFGGAGGGSTQTAFGAKTGDVMTWATIVLFVLFLAVAMGLTWATRPIIEDAFPNVTDVLPVDDTAADAANGADANVDTTVDAVTKEAEGLAVPSETSATPAAPVAPATPAAPAVPAAPAAPAAPAGEPTP